MFSEYEPEKAKLSPADRAKLDQIEIFFIGSSRAARQFFDSIKLEKHLTSTDWQEIFAVLIGTFPDTSRMFESLFRHFKTRVGSTTTMTGTKRIFQLQPCGPELQGIDITATNLGRVVQLDKLIEPIKVYYSLSRDMAEIELRRFLATPTRRGPNFPLGMFLMWSTFDEHLSDNPFLPAFANLNELLCQLGLCHDARNKSGKYLLLTYRVPAGQKIHTPTIVEAYIAGMNLNFRPLERVHDPRPGHPWPTTFPCDHYFDGDEIVGTPDDMAGRPEAIHGIVFVSQLVKPPEEQTITPRRTPTG
jgi:hypothetical protein